MGWIWVILNTLFIYQAHGDSDTVDQFEEFDELHVDSSTNQILDSRGRIRIFHGVNFVRKEPPWYHPQLLEDRYAENLGRWGLNVVRLGTMWSGIEPTEGVYDEIYMEKLKTIVRNFEKHGVWVLLDLHQDVASAEFGTYDGIPNWLIQKLRENSERKFPWPLQKVENWFCGYITYEACDVYQRFYNNQYGAVDKLAALWKYIGEQFKDHKNILGYDLLNEPWAGNVYKDGSLIMPAEAGRKNLAPLYEKVVSAIREVDQRTLIFWEPLSYSHWAPDVQVPLLNKLVSGYFKQNPALSWLNGISRACGSLNLSIGPEDADFCQGLKHQTTSEPRSEISDCLVPGNQAISDGGNKLFGTGFSSVPGGEIEKHKSVLSWHYYFPLFVYNTDDYNVFVKSYAHGVFGPMVFKGVDREVRQLGAGSFLTEFGLCTPDTDSPDKWSTKECNYVMGKADEFSISWTYWDTSDLDILWDTQGEPVLSNVKGLSRPYPLKVGGSDLKFDFDPASRRFNMKFRPHPDVWSEVYLPLETYGVSPSLSLSQGLDHTLGLDNLGRLILRVKQNSPSDQLSSIAVGLDGEVLSSREEGWISHILSFFFGKK